MATNISAIPPVTPPVPTETPHGGHGHGHGEHGANKLSSYQQAQAHHPAGKSQRAVAQPQVRPTHVEKTDPDQKNQSQNRREQNGNQRSTAHNQSAESQASPAAIVNISSAARAIVVHDHAVVQQNSPKKPA